MKKLVVLAAMLLALVLAFTACRTEENGGNIDTPITPPVLQPGVPVPTPAPTPTPPPPPAMEAVTIDFWHSMGGAAGSNFDLIVEMFHESQPYVTINPIMQGNPTQLNTAIMGAAMARDLPPIGLATPAHITQYFAHDLLVNLDDFINNPHTGLSQEDQNDVAAAFRAGVQWNGSWYGVPFSKNNRILFYNREMFAAADLQPPATWAELEHAARVLSNENVVAFGFERTYWLEFFGLLQTLGGTWISEDTGVAGFAGPEGQEAARLIRDLVESPYGRHVGEDNNMSIVLGREESAMFIGASSGIPFVIRDIGGAFDFGTVALPAINGVRATNISGNDIVMFDCPNVSDLERRGAWYFMRFLLDPEVTAQWAILSGNVPVRYSAQQSPMFAEFLSANPMHQAATDMIPYGFNDARTTVSAAALTRLQEALDAITMTGADIAASLQYAQDRVNEYLRAAGYQ